MLKSAYVSLAVVRSDRGARPRIELVVTDEDARAALTLTQEFGAWAKGVVKERYDIDVDAAGQHLGTSLEGLLPPAGRLYLAFLDDVAVGVVGLKVLSRDTAELKRFYVRPHVRGRGVGRALVERLLADARALSVRVMQLETAVFMQEAAALYRSFGFVETTPYAGGEFVNVPGMHGIVRFMSLRLQPCEGRRD